MHLERPLIIFDIEATGLDVAKDRIVSLSAWKFEDCLGQWADDEYFSLFDPGFDMGQEVIEIHGITNEMVKGAPQFSNGAKDLCKWMGDQCDLAGFNLLNFDIPILWEEFNRAKINWDLDGVRIIDAGNIFKKKEERTLSAAVKFYCGREHEGAHDAEGDVLATVDVLEAQLKRYEDLGKMTMDELAEFSRFENRIDLAGKLALNDKGEAVYTIGKSKGVPVKEDPSFGYWMLEKDFSQNTKQHLRRILGL